MKLLIPILVLLLIFVATARGGSEESSVFILGNANHRFSWTDDHSLSALYKTDSYASGVGTVGLTVDTKSISVPANDFGAFKLDSTTDSIIKGADIFALDSSILKCLSDKTSLRGNRMWVSTSFIMPLKEDVWQNTECQIAPDGSGKGSITSILNPENENGVRRIIASGKFPTNSGSPEVSVKYDDPLDGLIVDTEFGWSDFVITGDMTYAGLIQIDNGLEM